MRGDRLRALPRIAIAGAMVLGLAGCSDVDEALFGPYPNQTQTAGTPSGDNGQADTSASPAPSGQTAEAAPTAGPPAAGDQSAQAEPAPSSEASPPPASEAPPPGSLPPAGPAEAENAAPAAEAQPQASEAPSSEVAENSSAAIPGTLPPVAGHDVALPIADSDLGSTISPIRIQPVRDTGTAVGRTVSGLRGEISDLNNKLMANAARLKNLRGASARATTDYQNARAKIVAHLQMGTTRANPELIGQWNAAQNALDQLSGNLNAMGALGNEVTNDFTSTRQALQQVTAAYDLSGAIDEDHRQLTVLEDETRQMIVSYDRLRKDVLADVPRETSFIANERASLAQLAGAIKRGELYSSAVDGSVAAALPERFAAAPRADSSKPLVVIKFDHPEVSYQQILFAALKEALKVRPEADFEVEGVSPTRGSANELAAAVGATRKHARDVMQSITAMGVPASRLQIASATDPDAQNSEVRVFVR